MPANQEGPLARTPHACAQHEADLAEVTRQREALADALEDARDVVRIAQVEGSDHGDRCRGLAQLTRDATRCMETIRTALRLAGRLL